MTAASLLRWAVDIVALAVIAWVQYSIGRWINRSKLLGGHTGFFVRLFYVWLLLGFVTGLAFVNLALPIPLWLRGVVSGSAYLWSVSSTAALILWRLWRIAVNRLPSQPFDPSRRRLLDTAGAGLVAAPFLVTGFGAFVERTNFRVREVDVPIPDLPSDISGIRILQLSDIHLSPYLSVREFERVIDASNELNAHVAFVTGDLISLAGDPLDACLRQLARLRTGAGVFGCMGNHEIYAASEEYTSVEGARLGLRFLRKEAALLRFGSATMNVAGWDYESVGRRPYYLTGAERLVAPGTFNVLLSHNPDVFPAARAKGFDLTLSGHTHGGQVTVEYLHQTLNLARFATPYVYGLYRQERSAIYVTRGIGTIGVPARIGAPPEISVIRLARA